MAERGGPNVYSIAAHRGFADALVAGLIPRYSEPDYGLARLTLLLPSQRAARTVTEAFVRLAEGGLLLPRMAVVGEPSARHAEIHSLVLAAHDAAIAAIRAGTTTGAVDSAARQVIDAAGMGDRFFHRVGHGLGLEPHEDPSVDPGSATLLEAGMVFTIEPGIYIPGWGGVRIEDDVVVERSGCRVLTKADRSLHVIQDS